MHTHGCERGSWGPILSELSTLTSYKRWFWVVMWMKRRSHWNPVLIISGFVSFLQIWDASRHEWLDWRFVVEIRRAWSLDWFLQRNVKVTHGYGCTPKLGHVLHERPRVLQTLSFNQEARSRGWLHTWDPAVVGVFLRQLWIDASLSYGVWREELARILARCSSWM